MLAELDRDGFARDRLAEVVAVSRDGALYFLRSEDIAERADATRQGASVTMLDLVRPYAAGPDLVEPRPLLRIVPGKLHGEPRVPGTMITSALLFDLARLGYPIETIRSMYPDATEDAIAQAVELERTLHAA